MPSKWFRAQYKSECDTCGEEIWEEELIRFNDEDEIECEGCGLEAKKKISGWSAIPQPRQATNDG